MNKTQLIATIAETTGVPKVQAQTVVDAFIETVASELNKGNAIVIPGFGKFEARDRPARSGRNPSTGETMLLPAKRVPAFKPGSQLREAVDF